MQTNPPKTERNLQIVADYQSGITLQEVGDKHNITRERVRQLLCKQGILERNRKKKPPKLHSNICLHCTNTFNTTNSKKMYCCKACHSMGSRNRIRKFSDGQLATIRSLYYDDELTGTEIAKIYGVHPTAIYHILAKRTYKDQE